jgi:alcohol dehydrogenase class IV
LAQAALPRSARLAQSGISRPLLVTDRGLKDMEITQRTLDLMDKAGLGRAMFAEVDPNPTSRTWRRA